MNAGSLEARAAGYTPYALAALRIMAGLLLLQHGLQKFFDFPAPYTMGPVTLMSMIGLAGLLELVGAALVVLGLFTRAAAFILSGEMAVAYFMAHAPRGFYPIVNQGELAVLYCFVFLFLAAAGPGAFSLDALRRGRSATV
jgi:putative oxidoreductase